MSEQTDEINNNIKDMLDSVHDKNTNTEVEDLKTLELAKIIVKELLKHDNIKSLSILNQEQVEDITNAYLLNEYYQIYDIENYIDNFLTLKRSSGGYLIDKISSLATNNQVEDDNGHQNFLNRIFKR